MNADRHFLINSDLAEQAALLDFVGLVAVDNNAKYRLFNPAMERLTGIKAEDVLGSTPFEVFPFLTEYGDHDIFTKPLEGLMGAKSNRPYDVHQTGRSGFYDACFRPLRDREGSVIGGLLEVRDLALQLYEAFYGQSSLSLQEQALRDRELGKRLGRAIRKRRTHLKLSQEKFASLCELHRTYITEVETGERNVAVRNLIQIARALAIPAWMLFAEAQL
jgi:PAS domain S-box-containing protein